MTLESTLIKHPAVSGGTSAAIDHATIPYDLVEFYFGLRNLDLPVGNFVVAANPHQEWGIAIDGDQTIEKTVELISSLHLPDMRPVVFSEPAWQTNFYLHHDGKKKLNTSPNTDFSYRVRVDENSVRLIFAAATQNTLAWEDGSEARNEQVLVVMRDPDDQSVQSRRSFDNETILLSMGTDSLITSIVCKQSVDFVLPTEYQRTERRAKFTNAHGEKLDATLLYSIQSVSPFVAGTIERSKEILFPSPVSPDEAIVYASLLTRQISSHSGVDVFFPNSSPYQTTIEVERKVDAYNVHGVHTAAPFLAQQLKELTGSSIYGALPRKGKTYYS